MRRLLLATVAGLGGWGAVASNASAQQTQGTVTTYAGGAALPALAAPAPGTVVVRLNGRVRFYAYAAFDGDVNNNAAAGGSGTIAENGASAGLGTATGGNKMTQFGFGEYGRLYPGFDGVAANGLKYGASLEIRQDQTGAAGGGAVGSITGNNRSRATLYFRRVWGYLGTNEIGTFRFGSTDDPSSLYMTGNFENFNDGGWNGDVNNLLAAPTQVLWPFADVGNMYTTNKAIYLSPSFFGFDGGISYEPSTANTLGANTPGCGGSSFVGGNFTNAAGTFTSQTGAANAGSSAIGCDRLSSTAVNGESARRRNTFNMLLRYRGSFGPVGVAATGAYYFGGHVRDDSGVAFNNNPLAAGGQRFNYEGLNLGDFGVQLTAYGFSVGGKYQHGRFNGQWQLVPRNYADGDAGLIGASYTLGPLIVGAHWLSVTDAGDLSNAAFGRIRRQEGLGYGGTYSLAPGISIFLSGLWGERKQNGYDFVDGVGVSAANVTAANPQGLATQHNKVTANLISLGTAFSW